MTPRVDGQPLEVPVRIPRARQRWPVGTPHERLEPLLRRRVRAAVEPVEVERLLDRLHVGDRLRASRVVGAADDLRGDERGEEAEYEDDDHHLEERERMVVARAAERGGPSLAFAS